MTDFMIFIVSTILSFTGGAYIAHLYSRRPQISYIIDDRLVLRPLGQEVAIDITYEGKPISNLVESRVAVWNSGSEVFKRSDLIASDPFGIEFPSTRVIKIVGPKSNRKSVNASVSVTHEQSVLINFDLLDKGDAFVMVVYYIGSSSEDQEEEDSREHSGSAVGAISGLPTGLVRYPNIYSFLGLHPTELMMYSGLAFFGGIYVLARIAISFTSYEAEVSQLLGSMPDESRSWWRLTISITIAVLLVIGGTYSFFRQLQKRRQRPPKFVIEELTGES